MTGWIESSKIDRSSKYRITNITYSYAGNERSKYAAASEYRCNLTQISPIQSHSRALTTLTPDNCLRDSSNRSRLDDSISARFWSEKDDDEQLRLTIAYHHIHLIHLFATEFAASTRQRCQCRNASFHTANISQCHRYRWDIRRNNDDNVMIAVTCPKRHKNEIHTWNIACICIHDDHRCKHDSHIRNSTVRVIVDVDRRSTSSIHNSSL